LFVAQINEHAVVGIDAADGRVQEHDEFRGRPLVLAWSSARGLPLVSFQDRPEVCEVRYDANAEGRPWLHPERDDRRVRVAEPVARVRDVRCFLPTPGSGSGEADAASGRAHAPDLAVWGMAEEPDGSIVLVRNDAPRQPFTSAIQIVRMR